MQNLVVTPLALALVAALSLSACASKPKSLAGPVAETTLERDGHGQEAEDRYGRPSALQADLAANAGDRIYFEVDSHSLDQESATSLARQGDWLLRHPGVRAVIAGNCDERGTREYNLALGARRAAAAKAFLISRGVPASRLDTISYGKERPIAPGSDEGAWSRNRNAQTVLIDLLPG